MPKEHETAARRSSRAALNEQCEPTEKTNLPVSNCVVAVFGRLLIGDGVLGTVGFLGLGHRQGWPRELTLGLGRRQGWPR